MLFLVRLEHENSFVTTHLIQAEDLAEAKSKLEDYLSQDYGVRDGNRYVDSDGDEVRVETLAKLQSLYDLTKWLPVIGE